MDKKNITIMLDAGHGSNTPGKRSTDKRLLEWSYNRTIVNGIKSRLEKEGYDIYIVHPEDEEIGGQSRDLCIRTERANKKYSECRGKGRTAVYVSVHVNAAGHCDVWRNASGWMVYVAETASSNSKKLAQLLYAEAEKRGLKGNRSVSANKYKTANFWVVRKTNMPAVLTENLFMDNKAEVDWLLTDEGKYTIIDLHCDGIKKYVEQL